MSKTTSKKRIYAEIQKVEDQEDGTIKVYGIASTDQKDSDGETVTADCMRAAIPDYMKFGAVREMHQPSAAGTAIEIAVGDDGVTTFGAHIVDDEAIKKVKTNVYKGFSIGGKVTERDLLDKKIIKGLNLIEVSLVDRPANPDAKISMYKAAKTEEDDVEELAELLDTGVMSPADIVELVRKAAADKAAAVDTNGIQVVTGDAIKKGLWDVGRFAQMLQEFAYLAACSEDEMQWEGDASNVPEAMRQWLAQGVEIFKAMAAEETTEMLQWLGAMVVKPDVVEAAAKAGLLAGPDAIAKAGARFSKATKSSLDAVRKAMKEAEDSLAALKYDVEEAEEDAAGKAAAVDTNGIQKAQTEVALKAEGFEDLITKALAPMQDKLTKMEKENETLKGQVTAMGKRAAPGKALLKVMSKGEDFVAATTDEPTEIVPEAGTPERAQYEMKKVLSGGGQRFAG